jgi:hypothetical protein
MAIKKYKPTSPGRRGMTGHSFEEITRSGPEKSLTESLRRRAGRNNKGRISVRHHGGGHRRRYRLIDFKRDKVGIPGRVASIEYDPNRSARIALIVYADGEKRYRSADPQQPGWLGYPQHRVARGQRRPVGARCRNVGPVACQGRHVRPCAYAQRRGPAGQAVLHGYRRSGWQYRPRQHQDRQGWP